MASTSAAMEAIITERLSDAAAIGSPSGTASSTACTFWHAILGMCSAIKRALRVLGAAIEGSPCAHWQRCHSAWSSIRIATVFGLLEDILSVLSKAYGLNLSSIHSRPDTRGAFRFYMEVEGHLEDPTVAACMAALTKQLVMRSRGQDFGTYPRCAFNEPRLRTIGIIGGTGADGWMVSRNFSAPPATRS